MPQIWPMNWIILFILFTFTFIIFLNFMYFIPHSPSFEGNTSVNKTSNFVWKW